MLTLAFCLFQQFTVIQDDPSADYQYLQEALDAVPEGSTLLLYGDHQAEYSRNPNGRWDSFEITKSVRIVGAEDDVEIFSATSDNCGAALWVDDPDGTVLLNNLSLVGNAREMSETEHHHGLRVESVDRIRLRWCQVEAGHYMEYDEPEYGVCAAYFKQANLAIADVCSFQGGRGDALGYDEGAERDWYAAGGGGAGIISYAQVLYLNRSLVCGGFGGAIKMMTAYDGSDDVISGDGGAGIVCRAGGVYYETNCRVIGGGAGRVFDPYTDEEYVDQGDLRHGSRGKRSTGNVVPLLGWK